MLISSFHCCYLRWCYCCCCCCCLYELPIQIKRKANTISCLCRHHMQYKRKKINVNFWNSWRNVDATERQLQPQRPCIQWAISSRSLSLWGIIYYKQLQSAQLNTLIIASSNNTNWRLQRGLQRWNRHRRALCNGRLHSMPCIKPTTFLFNNNNKKNNSNSASQQRT